MGIWGALGLIALALNVIFLDSATTTELRVGAESHKAAALLEDRLRGPAPQREVVVVRSESLTVDDAAFRKKVESVHGKIVALGREKVTSAFHYYQTNDLSLVSDDRKSTLMSLIVTGDFEKSVENVVDILAVVREANAENGFEVLMVGFASIAHETNELSTSDLEQGERIGIPVALLILLVLFGTVVAAFIPIGLAIACIGIALGATAVIGQVWELAFFVTLMITMIGLAVGIDYSLFIISRFRDELNRGLATREAVARAGDTAGRTVLFSGLIVVVALCGMLIVPFSFFQSLGLGAILVVLIALAAALTLLPAMLALLGPRINRLPVPFAGRVKTVSSEMPGKSFWEFSTRVTTRFPLISIIAIGAPMVAAAVFYFQIVTGLNGVDTLPEGTQTREAFFAVEEDFSLGLTNPTEVVVSGDLASPPVQEAIERLQAMLADHEALEVAPAPAVNPSGDVALLAIAIPGAPRSQEAVDIVTTIREEYVPAAFTDVAATVWVGGETAASADVSSIVSTYTPFVFTFVLGSSFLVLLLVFRSIVIPVKAVALNLLSVGTTYGLMVIVFQKGVATDLLGFQHAEVIDAWIPLFLFSILFGLSMDYHVFLLSRIRERYDQTGDNTEAVAFGLRASAKLITGAAFIMVAVFGAFASGETLINQQVGFGLAVAIFLDATLIRSVLVPASMKLLGQRNWYLPSWLSWLPDVRVEPVEERTTRA
ncbi:MAG: MMPL family transporter [Actinomycetia bacterium]|nr:MMPL family transporter [Actinomycetes bacterium]